MHIEIQYILKQSIFAKNAH